MTGKETIKTGAWDPEEDDLLYYWQSKVGNKWSEVAKHIPGRTGQQCAQRWRHKVNPNIRRDKWTAEEDAKLIELVKTFGVGRWAEIARNCDGRTDQQCMGRWRRHLDPSIKRDSWSPEEDAKLRQLHAQYGTSWSRISKCLKGRTSQQCRARWHQINNGRSRSGAPAGSSSGGSGKQQAAGSKRSSQAGKRKPSRRRSDFSDSEEEEDEEAEVEDDDDGEAEEYEGEQEDRSASPNLHHQGSSSTEAAAAAAAAAAAVSAGLYNPEEIAAAAAAVGIDMYALDTSAAHLQQEWAKALAGTSGAAAAAAVAAATAVPPGHLVGDDLACGTDQEDEEGYAEQEQGSGDSAGAAAAGSSRRESAAASLSAEELYPGVQVKQEPQTAPPLHQRSYGSSAARYGSGSSSGWVSQQQQQQHQGFWSPSRLLLSPPRPPRGDQHLLQRKGVNGKGRSELDEEETAGAETLLQMAHLLRRESCEFEPPSLRRSDFITASTPPKRHHAPEHADALREADELSPSPFKRARSSRGALFGRPGEAGADAEDARQLASSLGRSGRDAAAAIAAAAADDGMDSEEEPHAAAAAAGGGGRRASRLHAAVAEYGDAEGDSYMDAGVEEEEEDDEAAAGEDPILGFGLGSSSYPGPLPDPPARPSNASSLTACNADGAAAGSTAAAFLSPPPVARVPGSSSRWRESTGAMVTPRRPTVQQNLMNLLASPSFDRMAGYASPPSAGRTQPSAATLAALQSPQPSCVHEPFWTPFTGLFKDALFTRGTSATPDLPSGGKVRSGGGLFSPARLFSPGRKSNSASKALPRRSLLASPALERGEQQADEARAAGATAGTSAKVAAAACPADSAETGPSPAAACGLQAAAQQVNHRVVRRLDTHEAWGGPLAAASPAKGGSNTWAAAAAGSAVKPPKGNGLLGSGLSLFSPVKKQRVPLFSEGSGIHIGASPAKPEQAELPGCTLTIAPLTHDLPASSESLPGNLSSPAAQEPHSSSSPNSGLAAAAALPHGRSPLGPNPSSNPPTASWKRPPASQLLSALPRHLLQRPLQQPQQQQPQQQQQPLQQQQQPRQQEEQQQPDEEGQGSPMALSPEADAPADAAEARARSAAQQQQQQLQEEQRQDEQQQQHEQLQQELVGEASDAADLAAAEATPNTPVHLKQATSDNTSCSGTPNTPAEQRNGLHRGAGASPSDYVTPQHRLRLSRPLAPLHKDCLIAAATRVAGLAGSSQEAAAAATPAAAGKGSTQTAARAPCSADAGVRQEGAAAAGTAAASAAAGSTGQQTGSSDSSKGDDRFMDSPLQPCQQLQSPTSQWHQGMVAMLRNLQQTPLQPHAAAADGAATAGCDSTAAGEAAGKACEGAGAVRAGSRALRRLQDELERGSGIAAAAAAAQQQLGSGKGDLQMPFSSALMTPPTAAGAGACSAPMLLPLFSPAAAAGGSAQQAQPAGTSTAGTAAAAAVRGGSVASVSLTPAVISCSRAEQQAFSLPVSAGLSPLAPAGLPAVAWPVQQRPDGGLIVTAPLGSDVPAAAVLQLTPPLGSSSRLGSSGNKENAAAAGALQCSAPSIAGDALAALLRQHQQGAVAADGAPVSGSMLNGSMQWPGPNGRVTVVSIQPVTMLASMMGAAAAAAPVAAAAAAAGLAAVQPMLPLPAQPGKPCGSSAAVAEQRKPAAASAQPERFESSHAATVRSRLHALIDGV